MFHEIELLENIGKFVERFGMQSNESGDILFIINGSGDSVEFQTDGTEWREA